jgi:hypothetical protein
MYFSDDELNPRFLTMAELTSSDKRTVAETPLNVNSDPLVMLAAMSNAANAANAAEAAEAVNGATNAKGASAAVSEKNNETDAGIAVEDEGPTSFEGSIDFWKTGNKRKMKFCREEGACTCFEGVGSLF